MPGTSGQPSRDQAQMQLMWRLTGLAFMMSSEVAAGALIGWGIDHWQGTGTRWLTIGGIIGIVVGMTSFIRGALKLSRSGFTSNSGTTPAPIPYDDAPYDEDDDHDDRST